MRILLLLALLLAEAQAPPNAAPPQIHSVAGPITTFATHEQLDGYGFLFGPSDGQFGAIPSGGGRYTFYGVGGSKFACHRTPAPDQGTFTFTGTLDRVTGGDGCRKLFGPGDGPRGWEFDRNYAGGGQVVRFAAAGKSGWLMTFHGEWWWQNPATANHKCLVNGGAGSSVDCFYSSLGLAVSTDDGKSFHVVGEVLQPQQPKSAFVGSGQNVNVGYGSLVVADAAGKHLDNPPADPSTAYFYLFFLDFAPSSPGICPKVVCVGVARAGYADVVAAALSGDPHKVATLFHKYDGGWTQPATSDTPDLSQPGGTFAPLWTDAPGATEVMYDRAFDAYLAVYGSAGRVWVRASRDLIHWSGPIGPPIGEPGSLPYYPTLMGDTGDPTIAGTAPRIYFSSFPAGSFPNYRLATLESVALTLSSAP